MKFAILLALITGGQGDAGTVRIDIEGLVYNDTEILEWEGPSPPRPEDVGVPGISIVIFGTGVGTGGARHLAGKSGADGQVHLSLEVPQEVHSRGGEKIRGAALYRKRLFPFRVTKEWTFRAPVYETTSNLEGIRFLRDSIVLEPRDDAWRRLLVREHILVVNEGSMAFEGCSPVESMPSCLLAILRVPTRPTRQTAKLRDAGTPLQSVLLGQDTIGILGCIPPTGPDGEEILITYEILLEEGGGGSFSRSSYADVDLFQIGYPKEGNGLDLPAGFSNPREAPSELGLHYVVVERKDVPAGEAVTFSVTSRMAREYRKLIGLAMAFIGVVILAHILTRSRGRYPQADRDASPQGAQLARLDRALSLGEIDPETHARQTGVILGKIDTRGEGGPDRGEGPTAGREGRASNE